MNEASDGSKEYENALQYLNRADGRNERRNLLRATSWLKKSIIKGNSQAMRKLGDVELKQSHKKEAYFWYLESALAGDIRAVYKLAYAYHKGIYVKRNTRKAKKYFRKLYDRNQCLDRVCFYLGLYAEDGLAGRRNAEEAIAYYRRGMRHGDRFCARNLGVMYFYGQLVPEDKKKALRYYKKAIEMGDQNAYFLAGSCYEHGDGIRKNRNKAIELYKAGAQLGDTGCEVQLRRLEQAK